MVGIIKVSDSKRKTKNKFTRREFITALGSTTAGILIAPYVKSDEVIGYTHKNIPNFLTPVAITQGTHYERNFIRQRVQHLFDALGGIGDVVQPGNKVGIKLNLTGGSSFANHPRLQGVDIRECMWTHPEVVRAVGELIIDCGVNAQDIYFLEALWDYQSYNNFGYLAVQQSLGANFVNLNERAPYLDFITKAVGGNNFFYNSFILNQILVDIDAYISIPKMKQHYDAGVTHSIKNQVGIVPIEFYIFPGLPGSRSALHYDGGNIRTHLPRAICDLNFARPVNLAVIDGIKNAVGGEGAWNPTFQPAENNVLLAGKDPVASDSIASYLMGNDPQATHFQLPNGEQCDNYLELLHQRGMGTNQMHEILPVGDGAGLITSILPEPKINLPNEIILFQNFPNPFNSSTTFKFYLPRAEHVTIKLFNISGQVVEVLVEGRVPSGQHEIQWSANNLPSGVYIYRMQAGKFADTKKLIYQK
jgi:uncharacterized protein (DUF362 family)